MKAIRLHARDGPEAFTYEDAPQPRPGAGEVLIREHGATVTPTELLWLLIANPVVAYLFLVRRQKLNECDF